MMNYKNNIFERFASRYINLKNGLFALKTQNNKINK